MSFYLKTNSYDTNSLRFKEHKNAGQELTHLDKLCGHFDNIPIPVTDWTNLPNNSKIKTIRKQNKDDQLYLTQR